MGNDDNKLIKVAHYNTKLNPIIGVDFAGYHNGNIELVKCYKDNLFVSIRLDHRKSHYYVATIFDVKKSKIATYVKSGRLKIVNKEILIDEM